ncbi:asparaginase [soil metagenome]
MIAVIQRSGLDEEFHDGAVAVAAGDGSVTAFAGDVDRPFFIRSSAKPFQAHVSVTAGAPLDPVHVAVACASHSGEPAHVALVVDILARVGLDDSALRCPPARPSLSADRRLAAVGDTEPHPRYHNCSGKHAAMLAACVESGWPLDSYLDPAHPLQRRVADLMSEVSRTDVGPPGIDGCGAPVWRTTVRAMAIAYAALASDPDLASIYAVMARYPALVSGVGRADAVIGQWFGAAAKGGAAGCMGVAAASHGVAVKAWSGSGPAAGVGAVATLSGLGLGTVAIAKGVGEVAEPIVWGGGKEVGRMRSSVVLEVV